MYKERVTNACAVTTDIRAGQEYRWRVRYTSCETGETSFMSERFAAGARMSVSQDGCNSETSVEDQIDRIRWGLLMG